MPDRDDWSCCRRFAALSTILSCTTIIGLIYVFAYGPNALRDGSAWLKPHADALRTPIVRFHQASERRLALLRERLGYASISQRPNVIAREWFLRDRARSSSLNTSTVVPSDG